MDRIFYDFSWSEFASQFQKSIAANMGLLFHYWLVYVSATMKPTSHQSFLVPFDSWLIQTNSESNLFLRSDSFLSTLDDYIRSVVRLHSLTEIVSYPVTAGSSFLDKYLGAVQGFMLEIQETPHRVVYRAEDIRLLHYHARQPKKYDTPLLIVYAPVNRYHIMDIRKGRSVVEHFVSAGFDVYLLDWGRQLNNKPSLSDYINYIQRSVDRVKEISGARQVSILGYSWGGVLSMIYSSLKGENVKNLILQSAHVDFHKDTSILAYWFRSLPIDYIAQEFGNIDCRFINLALLMRNPFVHSVDAFRFAADMNNGSPFLETGFDTMRIVAWLNDTPLIPSTFFKDYIGKLYQQNQLVKKELQIVMPADGRPKTVDLAKLAMPLLNIIGDLDDICTPPAAIPINDIAASSDKELLRFPTGHIELSVGSDAHDRLWPQVVKWLEQRSL